MTIEQIIDQVCILQEEKREICSIIDKNWDDIADLGRWIFLLLFIIKERLVKEVTEIAEEDDFQELRFTAEKLRSNVRDLYNLAEKILYFQESNMDKGKDKKIFPKSIDKGDKNG